MTDEDKPENQNCPACDSVVRPVYMEARRTDAGRLIRGRWLRPAIRALDNDPEVLACPSCRGYEEAQAEERAIVRRLARMGVPKRCQKWRFSDMEWQQSDETEDDFRGRVSSYDNVYGVTLRNAEAVKAILRWVEYLKENGRGEALGIWIHGPVGSGKTTIASMIARELMSKRSRELVPMSDEKYREVYGTDPTPADRACRTFQGVQAGRNIPVLFCSEGEALRRHKLAWKNDEAPLARMADHRGLLIYDEICAETVTPNGKAPEWKLDATERLLCHRWDRALPVCFTSNVPARVVFGQSEKTRPPFGLRVADRLRGSCVSVALTGSKSWRIAKC